MTDNLFNSIHPDPRWLPFLRNVGYAPEQLAQIPFKVRLPKVEGDATSAGPAD